MTQIRVHRLLIGMARVLLPFASLRVRYRLTLAPSLWLHARLWPIHDPRGWWDYRRKYGRLVRFVRRHGYAIEA